MEGYDSVVSKICSVKRGKEEFNISDLSRLFGLSSETLRKYEKLHIVEPIRRDNNYRVYSSWEITKIIRARQLKYECSSLVEVDEHLLEMDSDESISNIELRKKELLKEIEYKQRLLMWLDSRKRAIESYKENEGRVYFKKEEKIYCCIYMVGNTITDKRGDDLRVLQQWMEALPFVSVYYIGINDGRTVSCVGISESERKLYHLEYLKEDFVIGEADYLEYNDYAAHSQDFDTSSECIDRGYEISRKQGIGFEDLFVIKMVGYVQRAGIYKSHNIMMYPVKK